MADNVNAARGALAEFVAWRLSVLDINATELADRAGVARASVYRLMEDGPPRTVATDHLHKLAGALEVDPRVLAEVWHGLSHSGETQDERGQMVRGFVLSVSDLTDEEIRDALDIARRAAALARKNRPGR